MRLWALFVVASTAAGYALRTQLPLHGSRYAMSSTHPGAVASETVPAPSAAQAEALTLHSSLVSHAQTDTPLGAALTQALQILADALRLYGPEAVVTSFNGGKDAVVVLHLMRAALAAHDERAGTRSRLAVIFFEVEDEFPQARRIVSRENVRPASHCCGCCPYCC